MDAIVPVSLSSEQRAVIDALCDTFFPALSPTESHTIANIALTTRFSDIAAIAPTRHLQQNDSSQTHDDLYNNYIAFCERPGHIFSDAFIHFIEDRRHLDTKCVDELLLALYLLSTSWGTLLLTGYSIPFYQLQQEQREQAILSLMSSMFETKRLIGNIFRGLICKVIMSYIDPDMHVNINWNGLGYTGPQAFLHQTMPSQCIKSSKTYPSDIVAKIIPPQLVNVSNTLFLAQIVQQCILVEQRSASLPHRVTPTTQYLNTQTITSVESLVKPSTSVNFNPQRQTQQSSRHGSLQDLIISALSSRLHTFPIVPVSSHQHIPTLIYDALIIGSGSGAGPVALQLSQAGYRVLIVEQGPSYEELSLIENDSLHDMYMNGGTLVTADKSIALLAGNTFGGGSAINWACSLDLPHTVREEWNNEYGLTFCQSPIFDICQQRVKDIMRVTQPDVLNTPNNLLCRGAQRLGLQHKICPQNATQPHNCAYCCFGCPTQGKQGSNNSFIPLAQRYGADVLTNCYVDQLLIKDPKKTSRGSALSTVISLPSQHNSIESQGYDTKHGHTTQFSISDSSLHMIPGSGSTLAATSSSSSSSSSSLPSDSDALALPQTPHHNLLTRRQLSKAMQTVSAAVLASPRTLIQIPGCELVSNTILQTQTMTIGQQHVLQQSLSSSAGAGTAAGASSSAAAPSSPPPTPIIPNTSLPDHQHHHPTVQQQPSSLSAAAPQTISLRLPSIPLLPPPSSPSSPSPSTPGYPIPLQLLQGLRFPALNESRSVYGANLLVRLPTVKHDESDTSGALPAFMKIPVHAKVVISACGALQTPLLLRRSGLSNPNIGRNLRIHPVAGLGAVYPEPVYTWSGAPMTAVCDEMRCQTAGYGALIECPSVHPGLLSFALPWSGGYHFKRYSVLMTHIAPFIVLTRDMTSSGQITTQSDVLASNRILAATAAKLAHIAPESQQLSLSNELKNQSSSSSSSLSTFSHVKSALHGEYILHDPSAPPSPVNSDTTISPKSQSPSIPSSKHLPAFPLPRPDIDYTFSSEDKQHMLEGIITAIRIHAAAGATEILLPFLGMKSFSPDPILRENDPKLDALITLIRCHGISAHNISLFSAHQMGTARCSTNKHQGAVRENGETYDVENLFVADTSLFPTASGVNPMITTMTLSQYVALHIQMRLGQLTLLENALNDPTTPLFDINAKL